MAVGSMLALLFIGYLLVSRAGDEGPVSRPGEEPVSVERGKRLFWGRGRCYLCHQIGERGGIRRGPELGQGALGPPIGTRAAARALERSSQTGRAFSAADYLVESLLEPGAYLVEGYRNEMPPALRSPVPLGPDEVRSLVAYMQSLGGSVDLSSIRLPEGSGGAGEQGRQEAAGRGN